MLSRLLLLLLAPAIMAVGAGAEEPGLPPAGMARVEGGAYLPLYGDRAQPREVKPFLLDVRAVTNAEFLEFVRRHPGWRRSAVRHLRADEGYLRNWAGDLELGPNCPPDSPVTQVSWFAARAYLASVGKRLPTEDEWEFAARADATRADATADPAYLERILAWYAQAKPARLPAAGSGPADFRGIRGLHGLVWEWVEDFNNQMVTGAARDDAGLSRGLFCAAGAASATDVANYAAFMRYAFRSSLKGAFTVDMLGFRGARDLPSQPSHP